MSGSPIAAVQVAGIRADGCFTDGNERPAQTRRSRRAPSQLQQQVDDREQDAGSQQPSSPAGESFASGDNEDPRQ